MDVTLFIRQRLDELHLDQKDLARAAEVTESYVSQLLTRRKAPPASDRTDIYEKMETFLKLPRGQLRQLADFQRNEELKRVLAQDASPLFGDVRELILRKATPDKQKHLRAVFEKEPFGELEQLVTQKLLDVVKAVAGTELENEEWLRGVALLAGHSYEEMRVIVLEFLDTDMFHLSAQHCHSFLEPLIQSWDIDLTTFGLQIVLNERMVNGHVKKFEFREIDPEVVSLEPGLIDFLEDPALSGNATEDEVTFLKSLRIKGRRPTALYYYRELQNLRDPLHFRAAK